MFAVKYRETKEYLNKQQDIDTLLVLSGMLDMSKTIDSETIKTINKKISKILERIN